MGKEKFVYNTQTLRYEKVEVTLKERIIQFFGFFCAVVVSVIILSQLIWSYFPSPKEKALIQENRQLQADIQNLGQELENVSLVIQNLQERDAGVHRMLFGMDPIDQDVWEGGVGGHNRYPELDAYSKTSGNLLRDTKTKLDRIRRQVKLQSESLDTIISMAKDREKMFSSIPSIKPVRSDKLARSVRLLSGFGYRIHPVYKIPKMHTGIDFTAPRGTPIQATGDGRVVAVKKKARGYGHHVIIDHGYGYKTLYGHMSRMDVTVGEKVKKGQQIGLVGSTGTSTAPHCHYEVHYQGKKINPLDFCLDGLTPEEYQQLVKLAEVANQSFD
ncbi:MAG: peptidoglycan DD-metalloendopeptidase family protein [Bacteroidota bacterium]